MENNFYKWDILTLVFDLAYNLISLNELLKTALYSCSLENTNFTLINLRNGHYTRTIIADHRFPRRPEKAAP